MKPELLWIQADLAVIELNVRRWIRDVQIIAELTIDDGLLYLQTRNPAIIVLSAGSPQTTDETLIRLLKSAQNIPVIVYDINGTVDDAIRFTQLGAFHVLVGELNPVQLSAVVTRALAVSPPRATDSNDIAPWRKLVIGTSRQMLAVCDIIELIAAKRCTVLISGESGTGKEVIARAVHAASNRSHLPLVAVNCTALPAALVEAELFGHAKGAFTGAHSTRIGRFEQAHRGSIFLDEIGDLPIESQSKLLRVLQEQEFQRIGSSETIRVDVRVIAASNVDLGQAIKERRFREDLYYRLNVVPIHLAALRERREDIPDLVEHFLQKIQSLEDASPKRVTPETVRYLQTLDWPGNVRQLEHSVQMAFALSGDRKILYPADFGMKPEASIFSVPNAHSQAAAKIQNSPQVTESGLDFDETVTNFERSLLNQALAVSGGNRAKAANLLHMKRTTLLAKIKSLDERVPAPAASRLNSKAVAVLKPASAALVSSPKTAVRKFIVECLKAEGYRTLEARSFEETREVFECWEADISLLVFDSEGAAANAAMRTVESVHTQSPHVAIVVVTDDGTSTSTADRGGRVSWISKPFSPSDLITAVQSAAAMRSVTLSDGVCA